MEYIWLFVLLRTLDLDFVKHNHKFVLELQDFEVLLLFLFLAQRPHTHCDHHIGVVVLLLQELLRVVRTLLVGFLGWGFLLLE